jgi:YesN/AraC family two-component response regulator
LLEAVRRNDEESFEQGLSLFLDDCGKLQSESALHEMARLALECNAFSRGLTAEVSSGDVSQFMERLADLESRKELEHFFLELFGDATKALLVANRNRSYELVEVVKAYLNQNYQDPGLSVSSLAEMNSVSTSWLSRVFNEFLGTSFPEYVKNLRLEQARTLLVESDNIVISRIASQVGFHNNTYFSQLFKEKYGVTPSRFHQLLAEKNKPARN